MHCSCSAGKPSAAAQLLLFDDQRDPLDRGVARFAKRPRHRLTVTALVDRPAAERVLSGRQPWQQHCPVSLGQTQRPFLRATRGVEPQGLLRNSLVSQVSAPRWAGDLAVANQLTTAGVYHEFYVGQGIGHQLDTTIFNLNFGGQTLLQRNTDFLATHLVPEPSALLLAGFAAVFALARLRRASFAVGQ